MSGYVAANFLIYCLINSFTPGPGNILALNTVTNYGWKKGRRLFLGIFAGYYVVQIICAIIVFAVGSVMPDILQIVKYVGAIYILWLAFHIAVSKPDESSNGASSSFAKGFLLQFVNVKIYIFGITALTGYVTAVSTKFLVLLFFELVIATIGTIATSTWIGLGMLIQKFYIKHYRCINILLAIILLECAWSMITI